MAETKEEIISDLFVQVEVKLDSIIRMCEDAEKTFESVEWNKEKKLTLAKFDLLVRPAEGNNEVAKDIILRELKACNTRVCIAQKFAKSKIFVVFNGPGKLFPIPGFVLGLFKYRTYQKF